jgi:hypothetical protein
MIRWAGNAASEDQRVDRHSAFPQFDFENCGSLTPLLELAHTVALRLPNSLSIVGRKRVPDRRVELQLVSADCRDLRSEVS